jgi:hypothetical protein
MILEKKGWISVSISEYSRNEYRRIKHWLERRAPKTFMMEEHPDADVYPMIGPCEFRCWGVTVHPSLIEEFEAFLTPMRYERPCSLVTTKPLTKEVKALFPRNHMMRKGLDGTAISFALTPNYQTLIEILDGR